jgi:hypothetical protein
MDDKIKEKEKIYANMGINMPYEMMCFYYNGETLYRRMMADILLRKWKPKISKNFIKSKLGNNDLESDNCKVYKIISSNTDNIYIGSTCFEIEDRLNKHIIDYNFYEKYKHHYCSSFEIIKKGNYKIILLEENIRKIDILRKEAEYINNNLTKCVNIINPLTKNKIYDNYEEQNNRKTESNKYLMKIVCNEIKDKNLVIKSMDDMYEIYIDKMNEILKHKTMIDNEYYDNLIEFTRLNKISL